MKELILRQSFNRVTTPMILTNPQHSPGLATTQHPHFVGLALLRSLLSHEDVASDSAKSDAVLDLIGLLMRQGTAKNVLEAFYRMKKVCGHVCYLSQFRLRRWLEQQIRVHTGDAGWQQVELGFPDFRRLIQTCRHREWEWREDATDWEQIEVLFAWSGVPELVEDAPVLV